MVRLVMFIALIALSCGARAGSYWETVLPVMKGATNVVSTKDHERASIQTSYDILLTDFREPLTFYAPFLEENGWKNQLAEMYSKFPEQFKGKLPGQDWSSFSAAATGGSYRIRYASLWENAVDGTNATMTMTLSGIEGDKLVAHIDVLLAPKVNPSSFLELIQRTKDDPRAALKLAKLAGGDPFDISKINLQEVRSVSAPDELTSMYIKAVDAVLAQIKQFAESHLPEE